MSQPHRLGTFLAAITAAGLLLTGCVAPPVTDPVAVETDTTEVVAIEGPMEITVPILTVRRGTGTGSVNSEKIRVTPTPGEPLSVNLSEDEIGGFGESFQAAAWTSVIAATLLTGASIEANYHFELRGLVDGPSAGGITTAAILSLLLGDDLDPAVAMTGTINPSGTIGMVGGIPEKVAAVIDDGGYTTVLIPLGGRMSPDESGQNVDVVRLGAAGGVEVIEVGDITEAYEHLTGTPLPTPSSASTPRITEPGFGNLEAAAERQLTAYAIAEGQFLRLSDAVISVGYEAYLSAVEDAEEARRLLNQGLPGGAFITAMGATLLMKALAGAYGVVDDALVSGTDVVAHRLATASTAERVFLDYLAKLDRFTVRTLPQAEALATSYGNALDAYTLYLDAQAQIEVLLTLRFDTIEDLLMTALAPLLYLEVAIGQVEAAEAIFELGRDMEGPPLATDADVAGIASFLRKAADANLEVFDAGVVARLAEQAGLSAGIVRDRLGENDITIALAYAAKNVQHGVAEYLGPDNPNAAYAAMGYGWINFARNASLMDKYGNNGIIDGKSLELVGVRSDAVLMHTLDFARGQVAGALQPLNAEGYSPLLIVASFEAAGLAREGDLEQKYAAVESYTGSWAMARVMAYLGGFAQSGYGDG